VAVSEIGSRVPLSWPKCKLLKRTEKFIQYFVGSTHIVYGDDIPDELQVLYVSGETR
jgi:hypothetical protein